MNDPFKAKRHYLHPWLLVGLGAVLLVGLMILLGRLGGPSALHLRPSGGESRQLIVLPMPDEDAQSAPLSQPGRLSGGGLGPGEGLESASLSIEPSGRIPATAEWAAARMDRRLDELWKRLGLPVTHLEGVRPLMRDWEGEPWEIRALEIKVPDEAALKEAARGLEDLARKGEAEVLLIWMVLQEKMRVADLWVAGFFTHRIFLRRRPEIPLPPLLRPQLAVIVDDLGNTYDSIRALLEEDLPLTFAVFPLRPFSHRIAEEAQSRGMEVMMHLPMEPRGYPDKNPGLGALMVSMDDQELERVLLRNLRDLPQITGVNNHMGSRFTEERNPMTRVLEILASRGLYFVDSLTTPRSVGFRLAKHMGVRAYQRDVFLDVFPGEEGIRRQFGQLLRVAELQGQAVGICHPYPETIEVLPDLLREARERGFQLVTVSQLRAPGAEPLSAGIENQ